MKRYFDLDFIRGIAIVLMVIFHFCFDLNNFHFIDINIYNGENWRHFRYVIITLFLLAVGISLVIANKNEINLQKNFKRFALILFNAMLVSAASYIIFPHTFIYFGVLHFIAFASLVGLLFIRFANLALIVGVAIILLSHYSYIDMHWLYNYLKPILHLPKYTEDLVQFTPWFGVVLIGIFVGYHRLFIIHTPQNSFTKSIAYMGKHSLLIYMLHQPVLFGLSSFANSLLH
ncbi:heparan-alpha-glucosaminide N-acetyltransferase [Sulfurimonas sp.]